MTNLELKHKELMEEFDKMLVSNGYSSIWKSRSKRYGLDTEAILDSALSQIAEVAREEERQKIWTAIEPLIIVWGNDTAKRVRNYFTNLKNPVGTEEKE